MHSSTFAFTFKTFINQLLVDEPSHNGIHPESPIHLVFVQEDDLSNHEMLRRFNNLLRLNQYVWIRPKKDLTGEWIIDLRKLRERFVSLSDSTNLKGTITIEPEYTQYFKKVEFTEDVVAVKSQLNFTIFQDEIKYRDFGLSMEPPQELKTSLERFSKDFPQPSKCGFLMMKFEDTKAQEKMVEIIKKHFLLRGFHIIRADDKWYADDLFINIKTYLHGCSFGVALFERINNNEFNPNVSLEIGYMLAQSKSILYLKEKTLKSLPTDLVSKLYSEFDFQEMEKTIPEAIDKWLYHNEMIS